MKYPYTASNFYQTNNQQNSVKTIIDIMLFVFSLLLGIWECIMITCNIPLLFHYISHLNSLNFLLLCYFSLTFALKFFSIIIGISTSVTRYQIISNKLLLILASINLIATYYFFIWFWKNYSIKISMGFIISAGLYVFVVIFTWLESKIGVQIYSYSPIRNYP